MAKYLLLKHYRGAPAPVNDVPMDQWTPDEVEAHIQFMQRLRRPAGGHRRVRRRASAVARRRLGPLRRRGATAGDRRPVRRDEGPDRGLDGHRRRQLRASDRARRRAVGGARGRRRTDPRMAGGPALPRRAAHRHRVIVDDVELRELVPQVLSVLVRRGADFATAEDAVQEALVRALSAWEDDAAVRPEGWLDHRRLAGVPRHGAVGRGASRPRGPLRHRAADRCRCRAPTTPCASTSCARIPT